MSSVMWVSGSGQCTWLYLLWVIPVTWLIVTCVVFFFIMTHLSSFMCCLMHPWPEHLHFSNFITFYAMSTELQQQSWSERPNDLGGYLSKAGNWTTTARLVSVKPSWHMRNTPIHFQSKPDSNQKSHHVHFTEQEDPVAVVLHAHSKLQIHCL